MYKRFGNFKNPNYRSVKTKEASTYFLLSLDVLTTPWSMDYGLSSMIYANGP